MLVKMLPLKYLSNLSIEYDCVQVLEHMNHMLPYEEECKLTWKMCKLLSGKWNDSEETCLWCSCEGYRSNNLMKCK